MTFTIDTASTPVDDDGLVPFAPGREVAAGRRGRTTVARSVVESIVGRLAVDTPGVAAAQLSGIRGWLTSARPDRAGAQVTGGDDGLHVALDVAVDYPHPVVEVVAEVRRRVTAIVAERLDLHIAQLDVRVVELRRPSAPVAIERRVR